MSLHPELCGLMEAEKGRVVRELCARNEAAATRTAHAFPRTAVGRWVLGPLELTGDHCLVQSTEAERLAPDPRV